MYACSRASAYVGNELSQHVADDPSPVLMKLIQLPLAQADLLCVVQSVAHVVHESISGVDAAAISLIRVDRAKISVGTRPFAAELEGLQHQLGEGPTLTALGSEQAVMSGSLSGEPRWPRFGPRAGRAGLHSVLALSLRREPPFGAVTLYAREKNVFSETTEQRARLITAAAAAVIANAEQLTAANRVAASAQWAMTEGAVVERAIGILMSRSGVDAEQALNSLRGLSQRQNVKLTDLAARIVDQAARRARERTQSDRMGTQQSRHSARVPPRTLPKGLPGGRG